jgi:hypothetical protein
VRGGGRKATEEIDMPWSGSMAVVMEELFLIFDFCVGKKIK